jgi:hypothetical protein
MADLGAANVLKNAILLKILGLKQQVATLNEDQKLHKEQIKDLQTRNMILIKESIRLKHQVHELEAWVDAKDREAVDVEGSDEDECLDYVGLTSEQARVVKASREAAKSNPLKVRHCSDPSEI